MADPHVTAANKYARNVLSGKIPACKWVSLACKRHLDDLTEAKAGNGLWIFNEDAAESICRFAELMPHVKGKWAKAGELIHLEPWQCFILCCLFGWKLRKNGRRRFRRAYLRIPRKNGKSILAAVIGLFMLTCDNEHGAEVYSGATSEKQAWEIFRPARLMMEKSPELVEAFGAEIWAKALVVPNVGSRFEPIIGKPGDGSSPSCALVDEYHEHDTPDMVDTMETGMGAREQPLLLMLTTAGYNLAGPCYDQDMEAQKALDGISASDDLFACMYGLDEKDDWTDPKSLRKANPNFGVSVESDWLESQQRQAVLNPAYATRFKTKHLNAWCSAREALVNMVKWNAGADEMLTPDELAGETCVFSLDLASKSDLCASVKIFSKELHGRQHFYVFARYYLPEETIDSDKHNAAAYRRWVIQGWLTATDGASIDFDTVTDDLLADMKRFNPREVIFDPHNAMWMAQKVMEDGGEAVEFAQNGANMAPATDDFLSAVHDSRVHHDGNPITAWCVSNLVARKTSGKLPAPTKQKPQNKIDGGIAAIMGISRLMTREPEIDEIDSTFQVMCA